jgi:hypothetical protein
MKITHSKLLTILNFLKVENTAFILHSCHHMKYVHHNYDYINKRTSFLVIFSSQYT